MSWRIRGETVDGHVDWHMWDQRCWSEEREWSSGVTQPTEARVHPSRRGRMWARIMSAWRREKVEAVAVEVVVVVVVV